MPLLNPAAPNFSDPLGLLAACHERMLGFCDLLERLDPWIEEHGLDQDANDGARSILRYFNTAARLHHEDEELDLFPLLRGDEMLNTLINALQQEHRDLERLWGRLAGELDALLRSDYEPGAFRAAATPFITAYLRHIHEENNTLLPRAAERLSEKQLQALGRSMAARRQSEPQTPGQ